MVFNFITTMYTTSVCYVLEKKSPLYLTDDVRVRPAFSAVKFLAPNFFLETNSDYVKNIGSGEKTHLLTPQGTQGGYLGPRPKNQKNCCFRHILEGKKIILCPHHLGH